MKTVLPLAKRCINYLSFTLNYLSDMRNRCDITRYGVKSIYLATDDEQTVLETKHLPQFTWLFLPDLERGAVKKVREFLFN